MKTHVVAFLAVVAVALFGGLLLRDQLATDAPGDSARNAEGRDSASASPTMPPLTGDDSSSPSLSPSDAATIAPSATGTGIATTSLFYFGRPHEPVEIPGSYEGANGATTLRVQYLGPSGWTAFPLPVVTQPTGEFRAYVELGDGQYRLRIVDPDSGTTSRILTLLLL